MEIICGVVAAVSPEKFPQLVCAIVACSIIVTASFAFSMLRRNALRPKPPRLHP